MFPPSTSDPATVKARYEALLEVAESISTERQLATLFSELSRSLKRLVEFDYITLTLVDFAERVEKVSFVEVPLPKVVYTSVDADGRTPSQVTESLERLAGELESRDAIVLVKVSGRLSSGRTSEVPFDRIRKRLEDGGAIMVRVNRASLTSAERSSARLSGKTKEEIEEGTLRGALSSYSVDPAVEAGLREQIAGQLAAEGGLRTARKLLTSLEQEARENERKEEFRTRMIKEAKEVLGMEGA